MQTQLAIFAKVARLCGYCPVAADSSFILNEFSGLKVLSLEIFCDLFRPEYKDLDQLPARYWFKFFFKVPSILYPHTKFLKRLIPGYIGYLWNIQYFLQF